MTILLTKPQLVELPVLEGVAVVFLQIATVTCVTYRSRGFLSNASSSSEPIGPKGHFLKGNMPELNAHGKSSCTVWWRLYKEHGPAYELTIPFFRMHVINHPVYLEYIQKKNHQNFIRGAFTRHALGQMQRTGIFVSDGQAHHFQRKSASKAFSRKNFESHITAVVQHHLKIMLSLLGKLADSGTPFDFQDLMARFTVCAILKIAFHDDTGTDTILSDDPSCLKGNAEFILAFDEAQALLDQRRRNPMWQVTEYLSGKKKITDRAISLIYGFLDPIIQRRLETPSKMEESGKVDLLDLFIQSTTDRYTLGGMCLGFLLAGRDTTAFGTAWMFGEILHLKNKHLNLQQRVQDELAIREGRGFLEYGDTNKLKLLNALWDESARLNTVSPAGQLEVAEDDCLPAVPELGLPPRPIKKGDLVGYQNYVLHRMPQIWGDDAEEFKPERWFDPDGNYISHGPFKYHSWNAGPRSCLGRALATFEGIATAVAILSNFELELQDPSSPMEPQAGMNMGIAGGLWMTAHRRVDAEFDA